MKTPKEIAESIITPINRRCIMDWYPLPELGNQALNELAARIAAAIQAERDVRPPKGHIVTDDGVTRRVLGELPVTADGCVIGDVRDHGAMLFLNGPGDTATPYRVTLCSMHIAEPEEETGWWVIENDELSPGDKRWFSTKEAAEAAKKETT